MQNRYGGNGLAALREAHGNDSDRSVNHTSTMTMTMESPVPLPSPSNSKGGISTEPMLV
jgi:hypothetical protein